jgi:N-acetylglucosamine-6-phosphate deacetylase
MTSGTRVRGRLVLGDRIAPGEISVADGLIAAVELGGADEGPYLAPGFVDVHVHGWGGHSAMGGDGALDGMARTLLRQGVTSFVPTAWTAPLAELAAFGESVRRWTLDAPNDGAAPLGFNLEGPFLAPAKKGAHDPTYLRVPADVAPNEIDPLIDGLRLITIAPELPGALDLIRTLVARGVRVSLGHSMATLAEARAGYAAGATSTTHLFNAMSGVDHRNPGLATAALGDDGVAVELIADNVHVDPALFPLILRTKPPDRLLLVSDALSISGTNLTRTSIGGMEIEIEGGRATLAGTSTLAGCVLALDSTLRNLVAGGASLPAAVAAASTNPAALLGASDRGRIEAGLRADLVELDEQLRLVRVMRGGAWFDCA